MAFPTDVSSPFAHIRASDAERDAVGRMLEAAAAEGRLTPDEAGERLAAVTAARFRDELQRLVADLPTPAEPRPLRSSTRARLGLGVFRLVAMGALFWTFWAMAGIRFIMPLWALGLIVFLVAARGRRMWRGRDRWRGPRRPAYGWYWG